MLMTRLIRAFDATRECAPVIGWKWAIGDRALRKLGIKEVRLKTKGLSHPVICRVGTSDIFEYTHLLGWSQVSYEFPVRPEFIVDAGANAGYSALRFQKDFPGARIIALEPAPSNVIQFKKNCALYPNIILDEKALWATNTRLRIRAPDAAQNAFQVEEDPNGDIEGVSIDDVMQRHRLPRIDLLKIDIEGSEKVVFAHSNAKNWLGAVSMIMIEIHDRRVEEGCAEAVERAVKDQFHFCGFVDEYALYISHRIINRN
jgi:FkbM family methyltransferase